MVTNMVADKATGNVADSRSLSVNRRRTAQPATYSMELP